MGAPVVSECEGEYHYDSRKNVLEWSLPVIEMSNKSGTMEFSVAGHPDDFFPVAVSFVSKRPYCDLEVRVMDYPEDVKGNGLSRRRVLVQHTFSLIEEVTLSNCRYI